MRHNGKVRLVLPLLVLVDLADVVVADEGGEDFGELDLGDILPGARIVSSAKLTPDQPHFQGFLFFFREETVLPESNTSPGGQQTRSTSGQG